MKLTKEIKINYETSHKAFINFHELKCKLIDFTQDYNFVVKEDCFPENVIYMNCFNYKDHYSIDLFFDVGYGEDMEYEVEIEINKQNGSVKVKFNSFLWENTHQKNDEYMPYELDIPEICDIEKFCFPSVESFLNKLSKTKRNHPCSSDCYYKGEKDKNGECDKLYISKKDFLSRRKGKQKLI